MKEKKIRVGLIGASVGKSWASVSHIPALTKLPQYELIAVSTSNAASAMASKMEFGAKYGFDNFEELVRHPEVDLVVVAVKTPSHFNIVKMALTNFKHVYCEWPLGNGVDETEELSSLANDKNKIYAIGLQGRYSPSINQIKKLVETGTIGQILSSTMVASAGEVFGGIATRSNAYMCDSSNGATMLTIQFGHFSDYFCYVLGEFVSLNSTLVTQHRNVIVQETKDYIECSSPDQIIVNGILDKDIVAVIHVRGGQPKTNNFLWEIHGSEGDLLITAEKGYMHMVELSIGLIKKNESKIERIEVASNLRLIDFEDPNVPAYSLCHLYKALADDIRNINQTVPSFKDALLRYRLIELVNLGAVTGQKQHNYYLE